MTSFTIDQDDNIVAEITGAFKEELIPVVEYIAVHNRLSTSFKIILCVAIIIKTMKTDL